MKPVYWLLGLLLIVLGAGIFFGSGGYNVAADEPHWVVTRTWLKRVRTSSIGARSSGIEVPKLDDESLISAGAGNYDAMCTGCHLKPGLASTEQSRGLYPEPPDLTSHPIEDPAAAFWVIKHGIKMSGMPAWGKSMEDEYIWGLVAFLKKLPGLTPDAYHELVESSGGHQHGNAGDGQEASPAAGAPPHDHDDSEAPPHQH